MKLMTICKLAQLLAVPALVIGLIGILADSPMVGPLIFAGGVVLFLSGALTRWIAADYQPK